MQEDYIDELIAKHFAAEVSRDEALLLQKWLAESPENKRYFEQMQRLWQGVPDALEPLSREIDTENALKTVKKQIGSNTQYSGRNARIAPFFNRSWMAAAAALIILVVAGVFFFRKNNIEPNQYTATETVLRDTLTDGTRIALNRHSGLSTAFSPQERRVKLKGEAHFDVVPDKAKPFVIEVQQLEVKVLGTVFNIDNLSDPGTVIVSVEEGRVALNASGQTEILTDGQEARFETATGKIIRSAQQFDPNQLAYRDLNFTFNDTPLSSVIPALEKAYNVSIILKNKDLGDCPLRTRYPGLPLQRVLELLAETFSFQITVQNGVYELAGGSCK
jgi:transmembrane sensor